MLQRSKIGTNRIHYLRNGDLKPILHQLYDNQRLFQALSPLLSEEFFDLLHPGLGAGVVALGVFLANRFELPQQLPLSLGKADWSLDDNVAQ